MNTYAKQALTAGLGQVSPDFETKPSEIVVLGFETKPVRIFYKFCHSSIVSPHNISGYNHHLLSLSQRNSVALQPSITTIIIQQQPTMSFIAKQSQRNQEFAKVADVVDVANLEHSPSKQQCTLFPFSCYTSCSQLSRRSYALACFQRRCRFDLYGFRSPHSPPEHSG